MTVLRGARERARAEVTAAIKEEARRQLAEQGAAKLSLRAVARELGMVSSALYRYFPSRDDLLTALIIEAYDALGAAAEEALRSAGRTAPAVLRWSAVCRAVRGWAVAHPHEYALIYGSPVPGYSAPQATVGPASRVGLVLAGIVGDARADGVLREPDGAPALPPAVRGDMDRLTALLGTDLPAGTAAGLITAWAGLFGLISFEIFGQFHRMVDARDAFFASAVAQLAAGAGLSGPGTGTVPGDRAGS
ncbi:TetR/AcrR family transcriptional regulator [Streptomyces sp. ACA25]|uniref:TetR/AcrR family transcriptional regulator n=1 Tax=Streptomyces sp. ACA25 TaxID=3022596 RepID=UPI002307EB3A|nr:TetR/AcrR family transcriptional regulator [Streptomyces sp. ACA25]MDB1089322.1 TetR/AcrR family transcriptional regulator [Streptomyces sp. ACA25]